MSLLARLTTLVLLLSTMAAQAQSMIRDAQIYANRASGLLPYASPGWLRAQDVLGVAQTVLNRR